MLKRELPLILLLVLIMLLKGALWSLAFPLWQGPDEDDHYAVIQFIGELNRLPDEGDEILPDEITLSRELADVGRLDYAPEQRQGFSQTPIGLNEAQFEAVDPALRSTFGLGTVGKLMHATPLYYMGASLLYDWSAGGNLLWRVQMQRLLSVVMGGLLVLVAYLTTRELFPMASMGHQAMRLTVPILVAFHPMVTAITAVVSVDGLLFLTYALLIYQSILVFKKGLTLPLALAIGLTFVIGNLTKPTLNGYVPLVILLVLYDFWRGAGRRWEIVRNTILMNLVIIPPMLWWMQRSLRLNDDLFYFNPILKGHRLLQNPFYEYDFWSHAVDFWQSIWGGMFVTWWAHFGWLDTPLPPLVYTILRVLTIVAIVGLATGFVDKLWAWRRRPANQVLARLSHHGRWVNGHTAAPLIVWLFLALALIVPALLLQGYDLLFWWEYGNGRGMQGRYWLGTAVPMLTFFVVGLLQIMPREWHLATHLALRAGMILLNFGSLLGYILPRYYL